MRCGSWAGWQCYWQPKGILPCFSCARARLRPLSDTVRTRSAPFQRVGTVHLGHNKAQIVMLGSLARRFNTPGPLCADSRKGDGILLEFRSPLGGFGVAPSRVKR